MLVIGAGRLVARTLALTGCDLVVVARREIHRQLLRECDIKTIPISEGLTAFERAVQPEVL